MELYECKNDDATLNAQRNLEGRTHYVDPDTLRFHHSRVLMARASTDGLLFYIIESCALNSNNTKRGFRPVVFDLFGAIVNDRAKIEDCLSTRKAAERVLWADMDKLDSVALNLAGLARERKYQTEEWARMEAAINGAKQAAR